MRRLAVATFAVALVVPATAGDADEFLNGKDPSGWSFFLDKAGPNAFG
jgi:hypothetical protein